MWAKDHFYCKKHMLHAVAVGWDKEKEQDVVIQEPRKQRFFKRVQKLVSQKKNWTFVKVDIPFFLFSWRQDDNPLETHCRL